MLMRGPSNHTPKGPGRADRKGLTIIELLRKFPDDATAEWWFEELRWKHRPTCPDCRSGNHGHCPSHPSMPYTCKDCRKRFSVRKGTIMQSAILRMAGLARVGWNWRAFVRALGRQLRQG